MGLLLQYRALEAVGRPAMDTDLCIQNGGYDSHMDSTMSCLYVLLESLRFMNTG